MFNNSLVRLAACVALAVGLTDCSKSSPVGPGTTTPPTPAAPITVTKVTLGSTPISGITTTYGYTLDVTVSFQIADADMPIGANTWLASCVSVDGSSKFLDGGCTGRKLSTQTGFVDLIIGLPNTFSHASPLGGVITDTKYIVSFISKGGDPFAGTMLATESVERDVHYTP
jgi:hypothetical protein